MRSLFHLVAKEWLVLSRDWHALLLLFAMPVLFILVMSLALRDRFASHHGASLTYYLIDQDRSQNSETVAEKLQGEENFKLLDASESEEVLLARVSRDEAHFLVVIPTAFGALIDNPEPIAIRIASGPGVEPAALKLFEAAVTAIATRLYTERSIAAMRRGLPEPPPGRGAAPAVNLDAASKLVRRVAASGGGNSVEQPTSVQQSVPAWLLFAMFFIAIPLSTTWVQERQQGTLSRLRALGLARRWLLLGKLLPYYAINMLQVVLMLAVGVWLVPLCGGDALTLGNSPAALVLMSLAASFASVSYALLISNIVSTSEQATIFTGVSNLLLAVIGGVMVPRFIMPPAMQAISLYSPMAWGLEGFLDIFLRHGGLVEVAKEAAQLFAFGVASLLLAGFCFGRARAK
jgi:ABC-2 type transport system permease protein